MTLDIKVEALLNSLGEEGLQNVLDMAFVEIFRNYCIHNLDWFKGGIKAHGKQHRMEKTWMRFYIDHGRLPKNIDIYSIFDKTLTQESIENSLEEIYEAYKSEWNFDIMNPDVSIKTKRMKLSSF